MRDWTWAVNNELGGGYEYQWTVGAVLAANYLLSELPIPMLPKPVHEKLRRANAIFLEGRKAKENGGDIELQDLHLEAEHCSVSIQVKSNSRAPWTVPELAEVIGKFADSYEENTSTYFVFLTDQTFVKYLEPLVTRNDGAGWLDTMLDRLCPAQPKRRGRTKSERDEIRKAQEKVNERRPKVRGLLPLTYLYRLQGFPEIEGLLFKQLQSLGFQDPKLIDNVVTHIKRGSIKPRGCRLTVGEFRTLLEDSKSPGLHWEDWFPEPNLVSVFSNLVNDFAGRDCRRDQPLLDSLLAKLRELFPVVSWYLRPPERIVICLAAIVPYLAADIQRTLPNIPAMTQRLVNFALDLVHEQNIRDQSYENENVRLPGLHGALQLAHRLCWSELNIGVQALRSEAGQLREDIAWKSLCLDRIEIGNSGQVRVSLVFPCDFDEGDQKRLVQAWKNDLEPSIRAFNELNDSRALHLEPVRVQTNADEWGLTEAEIERMREWGAVRIRKPLFEEFAQNRGFWPAPGDPRLTEFETNFLNLLKSLPNVDASELQKLGKKAELLGKFSTAEKCFGRATKTWLETKQPGLAAQAYLAYLDSIRSGCFSVEKASLCSNLQIQEMLGGSDPDLVAEIKMRLAWAKFGALMPEPALALLDETLTCQTIGADSRIRALSQKSRYLLVGGRPLEAQDILLAELAKGEELSDSAFTSLIVASYRVSTEIISHALATEAGFRAAQRKLPSNEQDLVDLAAADYWARLGDFNRAIAIYSSFWDGSRGASHALTTRALENSQYFTLPCLVFLNQIEELSAVRVDRTREAQTGSDQRIESAASNLLEGQLRTSRQDCCLALDHAWEDGDWWNVARAHLLLARICLKDPGEITNSIRAAIRGGSSGQIEECCTVYREAANPQDLNQLVSFCVNYPKGAAEWSEALLALSELADLLPDFLVLDLTAQCLEDRFASVGSAAKLLKALAQRVPDNLLEPFLDCILPAFARPQPVWWFRDGLMESLEAALDRRESARTELVKRVVWTLLERAKSENQDDHFKLQCQKCAVRLAASLDVDEKRHIFDSLDPPSQRERFSYLAALSLGIDEATVWTHVNELLPKLGDVAEVTGGYLHIALTGSHLGQALDYIECLSEEHQEQLVDAVARGVVEQDAFPVNRAVTLSSLRSLPKSLFHRKAELLGQASLDILQGKVTGGPLTDQGYESYSPFSGMRFSFGSPAATCRQALSLLGRVLPFVSEDLREQSYDVIHQAMSHSEPVMRHGASIALFGSSGEVQFNDRMMMCLGALLNDRDSLTACAAIRAAGIQIGTFHGGPLEGFVLKQIFARLDKADRYMRAAVACAGSTLRALRPDLSEFLSPHLERLSQDASYQVRASLEKNDP